MLRGMARFTPILVLFFLSACGITTHHSNAGVTTAAGSKSTSSDDSAADLAEARAELVGAELVTQRKLREARQSIEKAERGHSVAERSLAAFAAEEMPTELAKARLGLDQDRYRLEEARAEFEELEAMYKADEFAKVTKELVLQRGRRRIEVAERELAIDQAKLDHLAEYEMPKRRAGLEAAVVDASFDLEIGRMQLRETEHDQDLALQRARRKIEDLEKKVAK